MTTENPIHVADVGPTSSPGAPRAASGAERSPELDQKTFFRAVENSNLAAISGLLKQGTVNVNAFNEDGVNALMLAVYQYERRRTFGLISCLLESGADPTLPMPPAADRRICIVRQQHSQQQQLGVGSPPSGGGALSSPRSSMGGEGVSGEVTACVGLGNSSPSLVPEAHCTRKITLAGKTPLLVALELKSALYVKGWDYRHWDSMLSCVAFATVKAFEAQEAKAKAAGQGPPSEEAAAVARHAAVAAGWAAVFESGRHETLEVWAEGKHLEALKLLLVTNSKVLRNVVEAAELQGARGRIQLKDASFTVLQQLISFLYSARLDPAFVRTRGVDMLMVAHKYHIAPLKDAILHDLEANPDNWIRLLTAALEVGAPALELKVARSICAAMEERSSRRSASTKLAFSATMVQTVVNPELGNSGRQEEPALDASGGSYEVWRMSDMALEDKK